MNFQWNLKKEIYNSCSRLIDSAVTSWRAVDNKSASSPPPTSLQQAASPRAAGNNGASTISCYNLYVVLSVLHYTLLAYNVRQHENLRLYK